MKTITADAIPKLIDLAPFRYLIGSDEGRDEEECDPLENERYHGGFDVTEAVDDQ